jgi:hypothetical protein
LLRIECGSGDYERFAGDGKKTGDTSELRDTMYLRIRKTGLKLIGEN